MIATGTAFTLFKFGQGRRQDVMSLQFFVKCSVVLNKAARDQTRQTKTEQKRMNDWLYRNGIWLALTGGLLLGSLLTATVAYLLAKNRVYEDKLRPFDLVTSVLWLIVLYAIVVVRR